jgi:hypothetical protein
VQAAAERVLQLEAELEEARSTVAVAAAAAAAAVEARGAEAAVEAEAETTATATATVAAAVAEAKTEAEAEARAAEAERTKGLMSDVFYEIARRAGEMEGVAAEAADEDVVSRATMLRCVRDVIKEATLRALSASAPPAEEGAEEGEGTDGSKVQQRG